MESFNTFGIKEKSRPSDGTEEFERNIPIEEKEKKAAERVVGFFREKLERAGIPNKFEFPR